MHDMNQHQPGQIGYTRKIKQSVRRKKESEKRGNGRGILFNKEVLQKFE